MKNKNILIIPRPHLGDFIWAISAAVLIKQNYPASKTTVIIPESLKELVDNNPVLDHSYTYSIRLFEHSNILIKVFYRSILFLKTFFYFINKSFSVCFLFSPFEFFIKLSSLIKAKKIVYSVYECCGIGHKSIEDKILSKLASKEYLFPVKTNKDADFTHYAERYQTLVKNYFQTANIALPILPDSSKHEKKAKELLKAKAPVKILLCMLPSKSSKNIWPKENFKKLIKNISNKKNVAFFIIGGKEQTDYINSFIKEIKNNDPNLEIYDLSGKTSLLELNEIFKLSDLLISVDTGIPHLAALSGIDMITLFGMATPDAVMPMTHKNIAFYAEFECSPCVYSLAFEKKKCPYKKPKCMEMIKPDSIIETALKILEKK